MLLSEKWDASPTTSENHRLRGKIMIAAATQQHWLGAKPRLTCFTNVFLLFSVHEDRTKAQGSEGAAPVYALGVCT